MQTETTVSARPSAHLGQPAPDKFSREFDLAELLAIVPAATAQATPKTVVLQTAQVAEPEREPEPDPQPKSRNEIFTAYLKFESDLASLCAAQGTIQKLLFGEDWWPITDSPSTQGIYRVATAAISNLFKLAEQRFAPTGGTLEIDRSETLAALGMRNWSDEYDRRNRRDSSTVIPPVDLDKIWSFLEATYGGDAGIEAAHRQNAAFIIKQFRLAEDTEPKRTSSSVVISRRTYVTKIEYGANKGRYEAGSGTREELFKLFKGLACAFEWAGMDQLSIDLAPARHQVCDYYFNFKPRESVSFTGLEIIFMKENWDYKFSHAAAEKLMLYLGTYGQS